MGDLIYSLSIARLLNVDTLYIDGGCGTVKFNWKSANFILPLVEQQPYIKRSQLYANQEYDYNYALHPENTPVVVGTNLTQFHASKFGLKTHPDLYKPWLTANISTNPNIINKKIIINRTHRYHGNKQFYVDFLKYFDPKCLLFLGLPEEYSYFNQAFNLPEGHIDYIETLDVLELAAIINTVPMFVGNQSLICAIATGLGKTAFIEYCPTAANYIFNRQTITYF